MMTDNFFYFNGLVFFSICSRKLQENCIFQNIPEFPDSFDRTGFSSWFPSKLKLYVS